MSIRIIDEVARRHRVTPRYLHKLFESEALTFSSFVLRRRLSRAHRLLSDPHLAERNISSVAFGQGTDLLEKRGWDDRAGGVIEASYSSSSSFRRAAS